MGNSYNHLSPEERGTIQAMCAEGATLALMGRVLGRATSTVKRELDRNRRIAHRQGVPEIRSYNATRAGERARVLGRKPRVAEKLGLDSPLWPEIRWYLMFGWSPQQIAGRLGCVSHETIYTAIYAMPRGELRQELIGFLRQGRGRRRPRSRGVDRRGQLPDMQSIHLRPPEADERLIPGHWEGDLIQGGGNKSAVGVLIDRQSLFVMLAKVEGLGAQSTLDGFSAAFAPLPPEMRQTLTYDRGKEMSLHHKLAQSTGLKIYFADPHSPWQRGICENTNGLLRQYLPKGTDLSVFSQRDLDHIAWRLNMRPRKTLGFKMPAEVFFQKCYEPSASSSSPTVALGT